MRSSKFFIACFAVLALVLAAGCGGSGQGLRLPDNPLVITSSTLPPTLSGELVDFEIPLSGGCEPKDYVVEVIDGHLPDGVGTVQGPVAKLEGYALVSGIFPFTIKITDVSCEPFYTTTQSYVWEIGDGPLAIVDANPGVIPVADYTDLQKYPDVDALQTVIYNQFSTIQFIVAGGVPGATGYTCAIVDDPNDPDDGQAPLGVGMAPNSCSLVGAPNQVLPGGVPFRLTIRATDSVGNTVERKFQWKVDTPPIIITNPDMKDGKAGTLYSDAVQVSDGVPPFKYELTDNAPNDDPSNDLNEFDNISYPPGGTATILGWVETGRDFQLGNDGPAIDNARLHPTTGRVSYPAENDDGPNYGPMPSEGIYFRESGPGAGQFFGTPRRRGVFSMYVHVYSTIVPNERGQHAFARLTMNVDPSEPPLAGEDAFDFNGGFTSEGTLNPSAPLGTLPEAERTVAYNPDIASHALPGLQLLADGGVQEDGYNDSPHEANRSLDGTLPGTYNWDWNNAGIPLPGFEMKDPGGIWGTIDPGGPALMERSAARPVNFIVEDHQLPLSVRASDTTRTGEFEIAIGPDVVIITESSKSWTGSTYTSTASSSIGNDPHDNEMVIRTFEVINGISLFGDLSDSNLVAGHDSLPATATAADLGELIGGTSVSPETIDLMRPSVLPAGWWNDHLNMNPKGGRALYGADNNTGRPYYGAGYSDQGGWNPSVSPVKLPDTPAVTHTPLSGIYNDGGKLYFFQSDSHFGCFVIRKDAKIYVPFAWEKGRGGYENFGDGVLAQGSFYRNGDSTVDSAMNAVPCAISPDGRYMTVKLTPNPGSSSSFLNSGSALALISLTGEPFQDGGTFQLIAPASQGTYLYSTSMVMTDQMIYFLTGNNISNRQESFRDHYIQQIRYRDAGGALNTAGGIVGGETAANCSLATGVGSNWTQNTTTPMQTPFHRYSDYQRTARVRIGTGFSFGTVPAGGAGTAYVYDGWNMGENSTAVVPFRVSADGAHCALLAGANPAGTSGTDVFVHHAWVASNGGSFNQASTTARRSPNAGARGYTVRMGPRYEPYGMYSGPSTGFEISDDGSAIAYTYNGVTSVNALSNGSGLSSGREDIIVCRTTGTGSNPWSGSVTETEVTANVFGGTSYKWKMGSLVFTKDNNGLIFWVGISGRSPTDTGTSDLGQDDGVQRGSMTSTGAYIHRCFGTYYSYDITGATVQVKGVMPTSLGGVGNFPTYTSTSKFAPSGSPAYGRQFGTIMVAGGFLSRNREYFYFNAYAGVDDANLLGQTSSTLLGIPIANLSGTSTGANHTTGQGFRPGNWEEGRSFLPHYDYTPYYMTYSAGTPHHTGYAGLQTMDAGTGAVYWISHERRQSFSPTNSTSTTSSFSAGPPIRSTWGEQGYRGGHLEGFVADVGGPVSRLSHAGLGGDQSSRAGRYVTISEDGKNVAYSFNTGGSTNRYTSDRVGFVAGIEFDPSDGSLTSTPTAGVAETSTGRGGESMAFASQGAKLFYAFKQSASNENAKEMVEFTIHANGSTTKRAFGPPARYNVLFAGR